MDTSLAQPPPVRALPLALERDVFLRTLLRDLAGTLQDVVGLDEASGFVSVVGQRIGEQINEGCKAALNVPALDLRPSPGADAAPGREYFRG